MRPGPEISFLVQVRVTLESVHPEIGLLGLDSSAVTALFRVLHVVREKAGKAQ